MVSFLDWDSSFFGLRIGKVEVTSRKEMEELFIQRSVLEQEFDLVYVFSESEKQALMDNCLLVDNKIVYKLELDSLSLQYDDHIVEYNDDYVSADLLQLALESGVHSRFRIDKRFPPHSYERLYTRWIEQSVSHINATEVLCYMINGFPKGLLTLKRDESIGTIGLVATNPITRGIGIGSALLNQAKYICIQKGINELYVSTQIVNYPACRLYEKSGFNKFSCTNIWHWWLN